MTMTIYANYGVLAHEFQTLYSVSCPVTEVFDKVTVDIPNVTGYTATGEPVLTLSGMDYMLSDVLGSWGDAPAIFWFDGQSNHRRILDRH